MSTYKVDTTHSGIHFGVRHLVISKVRGSFRRFDGTLELDLVDLTRSRVDVVIEAASIDTAEPRRDEHLRSADFFDAENFPRLTFASSSIAKVGDGYRVTGDLTIRGVTKEVVLDARFEGQTKDPWGGERVGFGARATIDREDFGLTWNQVLEAGGFVVGTKIELELEVEAVKQQALAA